MNTIYERFFSSKEDDICKQMCSIDPNIQRIIDYINEPIQGFISYQKSSVYRVDSITGYIILTDLIKYINIETIDAVDKYRKAILLRLVEQYAKQIQRGYVLIIDPDEELRDLVVARGYMEYKKEEYTIYVKRIPLSAL